MNAELKTSTLKLMRKVERELAKAKYIDGSWTVGDIARAVNERFTVVAPVIRHLGWKTRWTKSND